MMWGSGLRVTSMFEGVERGGKFRGHHCSVGQEPCLTPGLSPLVDGIQASQGVLLCRILVCPVEPQVPLGLPGPCAARVLSPTLSSLAVSGTRPSFVSGARSFGRTLWDSGQYALSGNKERRLGIMSWFGRTCKHVQVAASVAGCYPGELANKERALLRCGCGGPDQKPRHTQHGQLCAS
jgi:hypothetical protein